MYPSWAWPHQVDRDQYLIKGGMDMGIFWNSYGATCPECFKIGSYNTHNGLLGGVTFMGVASSG